jgi:ATP synthase protein I
MQEYYELKRVLYISTLAVTAVGFAAVLWLYSSDTALSYLIGSAGGLLYLRMLSRDVERLGLSSAKLGNGRLGIFIGLIVVATQIDRLQLLPVFLGFMTYKIATLIYSFVMIMRQSWQSPSLKP